MLEVEKTLNSFGSRVVTGARKELKKRNAIGRLSKSLGYDLDVHRNSFAFSFEWEDYGKFVDQGVKGIGGTKADGTKWKRKKVFGSRFKYRKKKPPSSVFSAWSIKRGIAPRSKGGQFQKRKGLQFALANSVYHTGLETTHFFTKPFDKYFKDLPDDLLDAFGRDLDEFLKPAV